MSDLALKTIEELSSMLYSKKISPVELCDAVLKRINAYNDKINAFLHIDVEKTKQLALQAEKEIISGNYRGALHGIPVALKDIFFKKGETTTSGSKVHKNFVANYNATVVSKLENAGAVFAGSLNMHEYALGLTTDNPHFSTVHNPWNLKKIAGGSSGGSGAAIAADLTIASLGTDTGGSIRIPASACGIVGLKPTYGRVSKFGCFPFAWTLDHIGPMVKTVTDAAIVLQVIAGYDPKDPTSSNSQVPNYKEFLNDDIKGIVIGINEEYFFNDIDPKVETVVRNAIEHLQKMGAKIKTVSIPSLRHVLYVALVTAFSEASAVHEHNLKTQYENRVLERQT